MVGSHWVMRAQLGPWHTTAKQPALPKWLLGHGLTSYWKGSHRGPTMITKILSQKMYLVLNDSNGKIDVITGNISYSRWFIRDSGINRDKQRVLESLSQITVLAPFIHRERQAINLLSKGYNKVKIQIRAPP